MCHHAHTEVTHMGFLGVGSFFQYGFWGQNTGLDPEHFRSLSILASPCVNISTDSNIPTLEISP